MKIDKGYLIIFEGGEGGGKTTQAIILRDKLKKMGKEVIFLREPGGTVISEEIREVVLSTKNTNISFATEVFLFQAARAQTYKEIVLPAIEANKVVIMDRSRDSSLVYQGMVRGFGKKLIEQLNDISTDSTYADATLLLDISVEQGLKRRADSGKMDRIDMENTDFHQKSRDAYLELAKEDKSGRWHAIDASKSIEMVEENLWKIISKKFSA